MKVIAFTLALVVSGLAVTSKADAEMVTGKIYAIELVGPDIILSEPSSDFLPPIPLHKPPVAKHQN